MTKIAIDQRELERETVRLTERYVSEVVVALDLCPWAVPALNGGRVQISVITDNFDTHSLANAAQACAEQLRDTLADIELVLLVLPRLEVHRLEMDALLALLRHELTEREGVASFALAAFHPQADPDTATGERFIPFLRRSPDPLVQAVRFTALQSIDDKHAGGTKFVDPAAFDPAAWSEPSRETLRARIARKNLSMVLEHGLDEVRARLDDICEDRQRTHRRLGLGE
jgi:hypothetical protein